MPWSLPRFWLQKSAKPDGPFLIMEIDGEDHYIYNHVWDYTQATRLCYEYNVAARQWNTGREGFELKQIITSGGCTEFDIEPARAVAKLFVNEKISTPKLKAWLEEKGLLQDE